MCMEAILCARVVIIPEEFGLVIGSWFHHLLCAALQCLVLEFLVSSLLDIENCVVVYEIVAYFYNFCKTLFLAS